jgi:hypothetical protein
VGRYVTLQLTGPNAFNGGSDLDICAVQVLGTATYPPPPQAPPAPGIGGTVGVTYSVAASATLSGFSVATFTPAAQRSFVSAAATMLGVPTSAVNVTSVTDVAASRRRGVLQASGGSSGGGVSVQFTVVTSSAGSVTALSSAISDMQSDTAQLATFATIMNTQLASNGVSVTCTVVLSAPTLQAPDVSVPAVNVSEISNVTEAAAALTSVLNGASGATVSAAQSALLSGLLSSTVSGNVSVSSGSVTTAAALVLAVVSVPGTALTAAVQQSALDTLAGVVQNAPNVSTAAGQSLLTTLLAVTTNANVTNGTVLSSASTEAAAAVMAVAVGAVTMTAATASTVMQVLQTVAAGSINVNASTGGNIVSALSTVATSSTGQGNTALLRSVAGVLDTLVSSQASNMLVGLSAAGPAPAPAITSSPSIKMLVQVDFAVGASSRLSTTSLTVEGSGASFAPMPADLFDGDEAQTASGVVTEFRNLAFDPYGDNATTGVTRLAFTTPAGAPIIVEDKSTPIRFTLPPVAAAGGDGLLARCQFYNQSAGAYATAGCAGVPSPQPAGHMLDFVPGYATPNDVSLALAWRIAGPMVDGGACLTALLDCSRGARPLVYIGGNWTDPNDASLPDRVFPDPRDPLNVPAVTCPPLSGGVDAASGAPLCTVGGVQAPCPVLRVIYGGTCALWRPDNDAGCHWDNVNQSFLGPRCVASNGTQCMCRHVRAPCVLYPLLRPRASPACALRHVTDAPHVHVPSLSSRTLPLRRRRRVRSHGATCMLVAKCMRGLTLALAHSLLAAVPTCSLSDMLSLNPADIVTKLRLLFIVVIVLFGISACPMHPAHARCRHLALTPTARFARCSECRRGAGLCAGCARARALPGQLAVAQGWLPRGGRRRRGRSLLAVALQSRRHAGRAGAAARPRGAAVRPAGRAVCAPARRTA